MDAILSGDGKSGKAVTVLLVLLNCGMLVVDSVTFLCTLSACFSLIFCICLCAKIAAIAKRKKNNFAFQLSLPLIICNCCVLNFFEYYLQYFIWF